MCFLGGVEFRALHLLDKYFYHLSKVLSPFFFFLLCFDIGSHIYAQAGLA
jgi:hypothetical protein